MLGYATYLSLLESSNAFFLRFTIEWVSSQFYFYHIFWKINLNKFNANSVFL